MYCAFGWIKADTVSCGVPPVDDARMRPDRRLPGRQNLVIVVTRRVARRALAAVVGVGCGDAVRDRDDAEFDRRVGRSVKRAGAEVLNRLVEFELAIGEGNIADG